MSAEVSRRSALKLFGGVGAAAFAASCSRPHEDIVANEVLPYVHMPEGMVPGLAERYATALTLAGEARGVIVTAFEGRPIRIDGNPRHPMSLGGIDVFAQADILSLYDPDRSQTLRLKGEIADADSFAAALKQIVARHRQDKGAGLRLLTRRIASPTLLGQIGDLLQHCPAMRWHVFEPSADAEEAAAQLAFGQSARARPRFADADVIVAFDADPLGPGPFQVRYARDFADRRARGGQRLYAIEGGFTLTGAAADERLAANPAGAAAMLLALANRLGGPGAAPELTAEQTRFLNAIADDLTAHKGRAIALAGESLAPQCGALVHWINDKLQAPVDIFSVDPSEQKAASLADLAADLRNEKIATLVIIGANPVHDAPGDLDLESLMQRAGLRLHLGAYRDETAAICDWHLPERHPFESWSDGSGGGAVSLVQPLIRPLYDGWSAHELIAALSGDPKQSDYDRLRTAWRGRWTGGDFDARWRQALLDGVIAGAEIKPVALKANYPASVSAPAAAGFALRLRADPSWFDGAYANNAWLQECPRPFSKQVWGSPIALAPRDAAELHLSDGDEVELRLDGRSARGPVLIVHEQAPGVIEATLGGGRTRAGAIGDGIGFNIAPLRLSASPCVTVGVTVHPTGRRGLGLPSTAPFRAIGGPEEDLAPVLAPGAVLPKTSAQRTSFNTPGALTQGEPYAWAMVIDTNACIGCNACVIACQAENNVAVIGPEEIARGRDMHWMRVDVHVSQQTNVFQPVPCMHCETAPCEPVCPVEASVHDHEGLNVQVYNRCIGTRFCEANCPYKVRRFNFFGYADGQEYGNLGNPLVKAVNNPDVSVRARGVMEKCTYCVQRISRARRTAEKELRRIAEGEVVTACQSACPTRAIHFGNLRDANSDVSKLRRRDEHYALLEELHTRPRTTYLARLRNAAPSLAGSPT